MQAIIGSTLLSSKLAQPTEKPFEIYDAVSPLERSSPTRIRLGQSQPSAHCRRYA